MYRRRLDEVDGIGYQAVRLGDDSTFKDFTITVDADRFGLTRDHLVEVLASRGIDTRSYFDPPLHRQRAFYDPAAPSLPVTEALSSSVISLPIYPDLTAASVERIVDIIQDAEVIARGLGLPAPTESAWSSRTSRVISDDCSHPCCPRPTCLTRR